MGFWTFYEQILELESTIYKGNDIFQFQDDKFKDPKNVVLLDEGCSEFKEQMLTIFQAFKPQVDFNNDNLEHIMFLSRVENYQ